MKDIVNEEEKKLRERKLNANVFLEYCIFPC